MSQPLVRGVARVLTVVLVPRLQQANVITIVHAERSDITEPDTVECPLTLYIILNRKIAFFHAQPPARGLRLVRTVDHDHDSDPAPDRVPVGPNHDRHRVESLILAVAAVVIESVPVIHTAPPLETIELRLILGLDHSVLLIDPRVDHEAEQRDEVVVADHLAHSEEMKMVQIHRMPRHSKGAKAKPTTFS